MGTLRKWDPLSELLSVRDNFDNFFDHFFGREHGPWESGMLNPATDMFEDENAITVKVNVPGMKEDNINVSLTGDVLSITGEISEEKETEKKNYYIKEARTGKFSRSFSLPCPVQRNKISATYENGILRIVLPKSEEAREKEVRIPIT